MNDYYWIWGDDEAVKRYVDADIESTKRAYRNMVNSMYGAKPQRVSFVFPTIENVIFNDPATIVFWSDGTKTVVKTQDCEEFDPEKGLAMAIAKKAFCNKGSYYNEIKKWTDKYEEEMKNASSFENEINKFAEELGKLAKIDWTGIV